MRSYENIMVSWQEFRENLLAVLEWVNEKERQLSECKNQVNFVDKDKVKEHIQQLKVPKYNKINISHVFSKFHQKLPELGSNYEGNFVKLRKHNFYVAM